MSEDKLEAMSIKWEMVTDAEKVESIITEIVFFALQTTTALRIDAVAEISSRFLIGSWFISKLKSF